MDENFQPGDSSQDNFQNQAGSQCSYPQVNFYNNPVPPGYSKTVTMGDWLIYALLSCIPLVNLVALIYFAIDHDKPSRANLARLALIFMAIGIVLGILIIVVICGLAVAASGGV